MGVGGGGGEGEGGGGGEDAGGGGGGGVGRLGEGCRGGGRQRDRRRLSGGLCLLN